MIRIKSISPWQWLTTIVISAITIRLVALGMFPLQDTSEARYGEMVRLMVETNDWITPHFDYGIPFLGKPPLFIWLSALSVKLLGINEFAARLPSILCSLAVMGFCWKLARFQMGLRQAQLTLLILTTTAMFLVLAGAILADPVLLLSITMILSGFWIGWHSKNSRQARLWQYIFFIGCGLGLLAKGPIALVLAGLPIFVWCLPQRRLLSLWKKFPWFSGILLTLLIALPWYIAAEIANPGFLEYFIIGEHFYRYIDSGWDGDLYGNAHIKPLGTIWIRFIQAGLPWSLLIAFIILKILWQKIKGQQETRDSWENFLWLWLLMPLIFFTFSKNMIWTYALPVASPMAILLANRWQDNWAGKKPGWILTIASITPILMLIAALAFSMDIGKPSQKRLMQAVKQTQVNLRGHTIYWQQRPFSGRYYSQGKALLIKDMNELIQTLNNSKQDFLIAKTKAFELFPEPLKQRFTLKSQYRDWGYWLETTTGENIP